MDEPVFYSNAPTLSCIQANDDCILYANACIAKDRERIVIDVLKHYDIMTFLAIFLIGLIIAYIVAVWIWANNTAISITITIILGIFAFPLLWYIWRGFAFSLKFNLSTS